MSLVIAGIWGAFLVVVTLVSRRVKARPTLHHDRHGGWLMIAQYTAIFTILTRSYLFPVAPASWPLQLVGVAVALAGFTAYLLTLRLFAGSYDPMVKLHEGQEVCERGLFAHVRHPLYLTQLVMMVGSGLVLQHPIFLALPVPAVIMVFTARREERLLAEHLAGYEEYRRRTGMFLPRLFRRRG